MSELIEKFGQVAWEAAIRQVQLDTWSNVLFGIGLLVAGLIIFYMFRKPAQQGGETVILVGIVLLFVLVSLIPFSIALKQSLNPEFYAIEKFIPGKK